MPRINLRGPDGNAFAVMAHAQRVMKAMGRTPEDIERVLDDAMNGDYAHLLDVCAREAGLTYIGRPRR